MDTLPKLSPAQNLLLRTAARRAEKLARSPWKQAKAAAKAASKA